jgi:hypothetical protein
VSTQDVLTRYIAALGGTVRLIHGLGDEQLEVALVSGDRFRWLDG